jgi:hypothetical protein
MDGGYKRMRPCEGMSPLEILIQGIHQRKIDFDDEQLKKLWFDHACLELEIDGMELNRENISYKMCRYATDTLIIADEIYKQYDRSFAIDYDADGNYWIKDN